jgi:hypothetical protein
MTSMSLVSAKRIAWNPDSYSFAEIESACAFLQAELDRQTRLVRIELAAIRSELEA